MRQFFRCPIFVCVFHITYVWLNIFLWIPMIKHSNFDMFLVVQNNDLMCWHLICFYKHLKSDNYTYRFAQISKLKIIYSSHNCMTRSVAISVYHFKYQGIVPLLDKIFNHVYYKIYMSPSTTRKPDTQWKWQVNLKKTRIDNTWNGYKVKSANI